ADALRRISLAWRSSRFSRSRALMRSFSDVVGPSRVPVSRSCWRNQLRSVSAVQPILAATDTIAAHCESYSPRCSNTIFTARSRTSGENLFDVLMAPSSQELEPPRFPGRFTAVSYESFGRELLLPIVAPAVVIYLVLGPMVFVAP